MEKSDWIWQLNNWLVLEFAERKKKTWKIKCMNCGLECIREQEYIKTDPRCRNCKNRPKGFSGLRYLYGDYKRRATKRKAVPFTLTMDEFAFITSSLCHYCGKPPLMLACKRIGERFNAWGNYNYNGIDQKEAGKGYTLENSLPCCNICNMVKLNHSYEEFIEHLDQLALYRIKKLPTILFGG